MVVLVVEDKEVAILIEDSVVQDTVMNTKKCMEENIVPVRLVEMLIEDSVVLEERDKVRADIATAVTLQHKVVEMLIEDSVVLDVRVKENVVAEAEAEAEAKVKVKR